MRWLTVFAEFVLVPLLVVAAVWCWRNGIQTTVFQPQGEVPQYNATRYAGPWLAVGAVAAIGAGLLLIDVLARAFRRAR
ncbi:hypothetical protein ACFXHA_24275 [Nocardia sp. NPDC059240]|uniref:hypothetical protein n=1 Tax=Nocardia sp. NPDC059240 TaxID=3346786 RepID=UPI003694B827